MTFEFPNALLDDAIAGETAAIQRFNQVVAESGALGARYMSGDTVGTWSALVALGPTVLNEKHHFESKAIACETMRRVRHNLQLLLPRLDREGYVRANSVGLGATVSDQVLDQYETQLGGPLPLSLRAFWRVVGCIDLTQSKQQMVHEWIDASASELQCLGDDDPLVVPDPQTLGFEDIAEYGGEEDDFADVEDANHGRHLLGLSSDRFHKANVSGGPGYAVWLPQPGADFRIFNDVFFSDDGSSESGHGQWFVEMLRDTQRGGGFRGPIDRDNWRRLPFRKIELKLAAGLLAI